MMNLRKDEVVSAELEIYSSLDRFDAPPCQSPKGKDVLNRLYRILNHQPKNWFDQKHFQKFVLKRNEYK